MLKTGFKTTQSNEEAKAMFNKDAEVTTGQATLNSMLGQGCKIKGEIEIQGTMRIDGQFEGSISCPDTLIIGKSGVVKAEVKVKNAVIGGKPYEVEYRIIDANGVERWVAENGQPQAAGEDKLAWIDGIISDISERKHNEMRIEALLAEQSAILDNVMFGVMFVRERQVVSVNRRCEELFGYGSGEMTGKSTEIVFPTREEFQLAGARQYASLAQGQYFTARRMP